MNLKAEIEANFDVFNNRWKTELPHSIHSLESNKAIFLDSYSRITTLNAWKAFLSGIVANDSVLFFTEALNDALVSHFFASFGSWRSALIALRSCIENCLFFLYYKDHPVELRLWDDKKHKLGFTELHNYLEHHPEIISITNTSITGLGAIKEEYSTLSRAVHASAKIFRMSKDLNSISLFDSDTASLGKWSCREKATLKNLNLILISLFKDQLQGTSQSSLRKSFNHVFSVRDISKIKSELKIVIPSII